MKRKTNKITLKEATMIALASTLVMTNIVSTVQPVQAAYRTAVDASIDTGSFREEADIRDIWFKAIYRQPLYTWDSVKKTSVVNEPFLQSLLNKTGYQGDVDDFRRKEVTPVVNAHTMGSYSGGKGILNLNRFYLNCADGLTPEKEYIPTMEFKVGSNIAYIDGKKFELETPVIKNKKGSMLIPMYHLGNILRTTAQTNERSIISRSFMIVNSITANNPLLSNEITDWSGNKGIANISGDSAKLDSPETIKQIETLYANDIEFKNGTVYVPAVAYFKLWNPNLKVHWNAEKQVAKLDGRYTPEAKAYGIFSQPGTKSKHDPFKDWEMIPQQSVASKY